MIQYAEPWNNPRNDIETRAREIADREQFVLDSVEIVERPPNGWDAALLVTGHFEDCMWCSARIPPGYTHCTSCAAKVGLAARGG